MGIGNVEEHEGRAQWEWQRLHDPATGAVPANIRARELSFARKLPKRSGAKSLTWTLRGPRDRGGRTRAFAVDLTNGNTLLAGSVTGGIWRSADQGLT